MTLSFIIPVYKVERYLKECIDSITSQTFEDYEILLIDDGSPDNCPQLCDNLALGDSRIKVFHKQNGGAADARNFGVEHSVGDYLIFIDGDDYIMGNDAIEAMVNFALKHNTPDLVVFNVLNYDNNTKHYSEWPLFQCENRILDSSSGLETMIKTGAVPFSSWGKLVRRSILQDNNITFKKGIYGEDIPWLLDLLRNVKSVVFSNKYIYAYRQNVSTSVTKSNKEKHAYDMMYIIESECKKVSEMNATSYEKGMYYACISYNYCILLSQYTYLSGSEGDKLWKFLTDHVFLLSYKTHPKVQKVYMLYKFVGLKITALILKYYLNHK